MHLHVPNMGNNRIFLMWFAVMMFYMPDTCKKLMSDARVKIFALVPSKLVQNIGQVSSRKYMKEKSSMQFSICLLRKSSQCQDWRWAQGQLVHA